MAPSFASDQMVFITIEEGSTADFASEVMCHLAWRGQ
jgi:hypothetical protein